VVGLFIPDLLKGKKLFTDIPGVHKEVESQIDVNLNNCTVREKEFILKLIKNIGAFITEIKTEF